MKRRSFVYFVIAIVVGAATLWSAALYLSPSQKEPADRVSANLADKASANVPPGCSGDSIGASASGAALDILSEADLPTDPGVAALKAEAQNRADTSARCAKIALLESQYADAAKHFAQAAAALPPGEEYDRARLLYLDQEASALMSQGSQFGDNAAAASGITRYRKLLEMKSRERAPLDWAETQNNLGNSLTRLGARESGTTRLEEAVDAYRAALSERTRERVPLQWAETQNNLGLALWRLGERESGTARLEQAVEAYRAALTERVRERVPPQWAETQNNLGIALWRLGERERGTVRLEQPAQAYPPPPPEPPP